MTTTTTPADLIRSADRENSRLGHENRGPLSEERGFVPGPPALRLPDSHRLWDEVADELPELYARLELRRALESLPRLDVDALPEHALQRAATVLGILVHAYHRVEPRHGTPTPEPVLVPWQRVCARLGRTTPFLSYVDLVVANWRHLDPRRPGPVRVEDLRLLVPTVGVDEEQFFYLTQLEMLARGTPLVGASARACTAVAADDAPAVAAELELMADTIGEVTRRGLPKIDPRPGSRFHVDPVVWAKTVAPLAVPLVKGGLGPSGTASPMFHLTDAVIGRTGYRSFIGEEAAKLRQNYPPHWRRLIEAVAAAGISRYADQAGHPALDRALTGLRTRYSGRNGLLARHRMKVAGYLDTSFRVGRDVTISGFPAARRVGEELAASRGERPDAPTTAAEAGGTAARDRVIAPSELLRHHRGAERQWIALHGEVLDVTDFLRSHPGGVAPLATYLGTDSTAAYEHVGHHERRGIRALASRMVIGELEAVPADPLHEVWLRWATALTQQGNVLVTDLGIRDSRTSLASAPGELTPYTLQFAVEAHERFTERILPALAGETLAELAASLGLPAPDIAPPAPSGLYERLERAGDPAALSAADEEWRRAAARDAALLHGVRETVRLGVEAVEAGEPERLVELHDSLTRAVRDHSRSG
ncbi:cytochrome b5 domain-containing protein [Saccharothrix sp. Mg75]|uniref:cytochrome b5 domain-containing protein n=1 Tax=Saccharothrix sp. Mg75 TaxID=3445357 RepID=UPI003EEADC0A